MKPLSLYRSYPTRFFLCLSVFLFAMALAAGARAAPGAHGPNGEHLDAPAGAAPGGNVPQVETFSEGFELVGQLSGGELSVMIDRYDTNEPVLNGKLEVEFKGLKAVATFHPDMGDYAIDDAAFVKALSVPGKHALLFTLVAGEESDLLEGTLEVLPPHEHTDGDHHGAARPWARIALGAVATLVCILAAALALRARRRRKEGAQ